MNSAHYKSENRKRTCHKKEMRFNKFPKRPLLLFLLVIFVLTGISQERKNPIKYNPPSALRPIERTRTETQPPYPWPISTPKAQGLDSGIFEQAFHIAENMPYLYSVLLARNGYLIGERYFHLYTQEDSHAIHSVSKSILSALVGIAIDRGYIRSIHQRIMDFFPDFTETVVDPRFFEITIEQLVTMTAGLPQNESPPGFRNPYELEMLASPNWIEFIFSHTLNFDPGEEYHYSNADTHLLSVIIARASGMNTKDFADRYLFNPLNISVRDWMQDPQGYYTGGFRMYFTPRDMARFGDLYLHNGFIDGRRILSAQWVRDSIRFQVSADQFGYGYLWRLYNIFGYNCYFAWGYGGQFIMNIPELDMVVVTIALPNPVRLDSGLHADYIFKWMVHHLLFPIYSSLGEPPYCPLEASANKYENRSLTQIEYINNLKWQPNPRNSTVNVTRYRIYQLDHRIFDLTNNDWFLLDEVSAGTYEYWHPVQEADQKYYYAITAVTDDNRESIAAVANAQYPQN
jgi:CubicO group peptidase (beta-lactamase class C family)